MRRAGHAALLAAIASATTVAAALPQERPAGQGFQFRTSVALISVSVTVTDDQGRFVSGLRAEDFAVYEDGKPQAIQQFDADRVPVSLGIALDTSGSMLGEKMAAAQAALNRFLFDLLGKQDEIFLYRFDGRPELVQGWTEDRPSVARALGSVKPTGGTAIYDTVAEAVPLAQSGTRRKKALVIISDGNDTSSRTRPEALDQLIRQSEVLIYAIGIDASDGASYASASPSSPSPSAPRTAPARPVPSPFPGKAPAVAPPPPAPVPSAPSTRKGTPRASDRVNIDALRRITDDSGGRTEVIVSPRDLAPATASIADELSRQYFLGYNSSIPKDGRWHTIEVRVTRRGTYAVRARRGFIAN